MAHDRGATPHVWMMGGSGTLCVIGQHAWGQGGQPYGPCLTVQTWALHAIERAEADAGLSIVGVACALGIHLEGCDVYHTPAVTT